MNAIDVSWPTLVAKAASVFGITSFRPGQRELLEAALQGRDAIGILPTGGGKSLTFQLASLFLPRVVVVVTPLISLSEDQTDKLEVRHVAAVRIDSTLNAQEGRDALADVKSGKLELVYVTPERLQRGEFMALLQRVGVSLIVIDEAHCVSQWGHDFRPAYLQIRNAAEQFGRPPILALTATATPAVERDIAEQLALKTPRIVRMGSDRPNLWLSVQHCENAEVKDAAVLARIQHERGCGLVYTATVRAAEALWGKLVEADISAGLYHGQLPHPVREATQNAFMDGRYRVVVATKAFGMGIDKPETRFVVHYQLPDSLESYYQEIGRAGRDGLSARTTLLDCPADQRVQQFFLRGKYPRPQQIDAIVAMLQTGEKLVHGAAARQVAPERVLNVMLADLQARGALQRDGDGWYCGDRTTLAHLAAHREPLIAHYDQRRRDDQARLSALIAYAEQSTCRGVTLLRYFGESPTRPCAHCDNCGEPS